MSRVSRTAALNPPEAEISAGRRQYGARVPERRPARLVVGVMGSATEDVPAETELNLEQIGRTIAEHDCVLITGACPGLPQAAVRGAHAAGGLIIGISPGLSLAEHVKKYASPVEGYDVLIYTGSGLMGREIENIRSADIVVIAGGRSGTLGEFAIAYDEGKLIGVLRGSGGVADHVEELVNLCNKPTGAAVLYDHRPVQLIERLLAYYEKEHYKRPSVFTHPKLARPQPASGGLSKAS